MITLKLQFTGKLNFARSFRQHIREGKIRSFETVKGRGAMTIRHKSPETPGIIEFENTKGAVTAKLKCRPPEKEWRLLQAVIGSLMRHYRDELRSIEIALS